MPGHEAKWKSPVNRDVTGKDEMKQQFSRGRGLLAVCLVACAILIPLLTAQRQQLLTANPGAIVSGTFTYNPLQVALLYWYPANLTTTFPTGNGPSGVTFDGANMWVVNAFDNSVTKLRVSDGANLGSFAVGNQPFEAAFDGANVWVTNYNSNNVTKLRASD